MNAHDVAMTGRSLLLLFFCSCIPWDDLESDLRGGRDDGVSPSVDPIGHWKLDETSGTTAFDASTSGNAGVLLNGPKWATGWQVGALSFDGVNDCVSIPHTSRFDASNGQVTVAVWAYKRFAESPGGGIVGRPLDGGAELWLLAYDGGAAAEYAFSVTTSAGSVRVVGPSSVEDRYRWVHLAGTYDGAMIRLFRDGAEVASAPQTGDIVLDTSPILLGAARDHSPDELVNAALDDVRLYNRALSSDEIQSLARATE